MKQTDIALLVLIVGISVFISTVVGNKLIKPPKNRATKVEVVEKISPDFPQPDPTVFNDKALNPTREIKVGSGNNPQPVKSQ